MSFKVTKIMLHPTRTLDLGPQGYAKLSAGIEIEFDTPVELDSKELSDAFTAGRKVITEEFVNQYAPYKKAKNNSK